jgi:hypothetical protein
MGQVEWLKWYSTHIASVKLTSNPILKKRKDPGSHKPGVMMHACNYSTWEAGV